MDLNYIINNEILLLEVRHIQPYIDINNKVPLKDNETIIVYHGFNKFTDGLLMAKFGLSGQERAKRIYSYEAGNNPKGLFVSIDFKTVERNFAHGGIIVEFATKVGNLEAPVWVGGRSYFVQGEYTKSFKDDNERQQQQLLNREKHSENEYPAISQSDRPELAWALYEGSEKQALFIADLNPNMIKAFWVNDKLKNEKQTGDKWIRMSRDGLIKKYDNDENLKIKMVGRGEQYPEEYYDKLNKIFKPNDDFDINKAMEIVKSKYGGAGDDYIENLIISAKNGNRWDREDLERMFYPKQMNQIFGVDNIINEEIQNLIEGFLKLEEENKKNINL